VHLIENDLTLVPLHPLAQRHVEVLAQRCGTMRRQ
jgi:hypothetical protein